MARGGSQVGRKENLLTINHCSQQEIRTGRCLGREGEDKHKGSEGVIKISQGKLSLGI